ncbi:hypothetical protein Rhal01_03440 [Rubritalea halochordaticola]|uniref:Large polyvalent protein-associated domain-containing protein n=1 Tax=Rubritalea halochordaticola TaxID=714537 RepID=A0ABP9V3K9_9BACT
MDFNDKIVRDEEGGSPSFSGQVGMDFGKEAGALGGAGSATLLEQVEDLTISGEVPNPFLEEMYRASYEAELEYQQKLGKWREETNDMVQGDVLNFEKFRPDQMEEVRKGILIRKYMEVNHDVIPASLENYEIQRDIIADKVFGGRGKESEDAFFEELKVFYGGRKDRSDLGDSLVKAAILDKLSGGKAENSFSVWSKATANHAGRRNGLDGSYFKSWNEVQQSIESEYGHVLPEIQQLFKAAADGDLSFWMLSDLTLDMSEDDIRDLMMGVGMAAKLYPVDSKEASIWSNFKKQASRDADSIGGKIWRGSIDLLVKSSGMGHSSLHPGMTMNPEVARQIAEVKEEGERLEKHRNLVEGLLAEMEQVRNGLDPIKFLSEEDSNWRYAEEGLYATPGVGMTIVVGLPPGFGTVTMMGLLERSAYADIYLRAVESGMDRSYARGIAEDISGPIAAAQLLPEKIGLKGLTGKLPVLSRFLDKLPNSLQNRAVRLGMGTVIRAGGETVTEEIETIIGEAGHGLSQALGEDMPGSDWDAHWANFKDRNLTTFMSTLLYAGFGTAIHDTSITKQANQAVQADIEVLLASGYERSRVESLKQVKGEFARNIAFQEMLESKDFSRQETKDAVNRLQEMARDDNFLKILEDAQEAGIIPEIVLTPGSETVMLVDKLSGDVLASEISRADAAQFIAIMVMRKDSQRQLVMDTLLTQIQGNQILLDERGDGETRLRPTDRLTQIQAREEFEGTAQRIEDEVELMERLDGGDGSITRFVMGASIPDGYQGRTNSVNYQFGGSNLFTAIHEHTHETRRRLMKSGHFTFDEQLDSIQEIDKAISEMTFTEMRDGKKVSVSGKEITFLPENFESLDTRKKETALDEAFSQLAEVMVLRTRGGKKTKFRELLNRNLAAQVQAGNPQARKLKAFLRAMREWFGLNLHRAEIMKRAEREGHLDSAKLDELQTKIFDAGPEIQDKAGSQINVDATHIKPEIQFSFGRVPLYMPEATIGHRLAANNHPDYKAAKSGDVEAAYRLAKDLVTPGFVEAIKNSMTGDVTDIVPVVALEKTGQNTIPIAVAERLGHEFGTKVESGILKVSATNRSDLSGLDRVFSRVEFDGPVQQGGRYLIVDDTLTQGGTLRGIGDHIARNGGEVVGVTALTGKLFSAKLTPDAESIQQVRQRIGDIEESFRRATGYGFDELTASEARTLINWRPLESLRDRILEEARKSGQQEDSRVDGDGEGSGGVSYSLGHGSEVDARAVEAQQVSFSVANQPQFLEYTGNGKQRFQALREPGALYSRITEGAQDGRQTFKHGRGYLSGLAIPRKHGREIAGMDRVSRSIREAEGEILPTSLEGEGFESVGAGGEHTVVLEGRTFQAVKFTKAGFAGAQGMDAGAYLLRWALHNRVFKDDVAVEGVVQLDGDEEARLVISQDFIQGEDASAEEIAGLLKGKGFVEVGDAWVHPVLEVKVWDVQTPGNFLRDGEGNIHAVDELIAPANQLEIDAAREQGGFGRVSFSIADRAGEVGKSALPERIDRAANTSPIHLTIDTSTDKKLLRSEAAEKAKQVLLKGVKNEHAGIEVFANNKSFKHTKDHAGSHRRLAILGEIEQVIKGATWLVAADPDQRKAEQRLQEYTNHHLAHPVTINGSPYVAWITVQKSHNGRNLYNIQDIELLETKVSPKEAEVELNKPTPLSRDDISTVIRERLKVKELLQREDGSFSIGSASQLDERADSLDVEANERSLAEETFDYNAVPSFSVDISHLNKSPSEYSYEPETNIPQRVQEILGQERAISVYPEVLRDSLRQFEAATGTSIRFFQPEEGQLITAFTTRSLPDTIFINSRANTSLAYLIGHEWTHVAQKDSAIAEDLRKLIETYTSDRERRILWEYILYLNPYTEAERLNEIEAHIFGDIISNTNDFGIDALSQSQELREKGLKLYHDATALNPDAHAGVSDSELASFSIGKTTNLEYDEKHERTREEENADTSGSAARTALERLERWFVDDPGREGGANAAQRIDSETESLLAWARGEGLLIRPDSWVANVKEWTELEGASEHEVYILPNGERVIKSTIPPNFGARGVVLDYVRNQMAANRLFGDNIRLEGILDIDGTSIVISQPYVKGVSPTEAEVAEWFESQGYEKAGYNRWKHPETGADVADAHTGNLIKTKDGDIVPIDLQILKEPKMDGGSGANRSSNFTGNEGIGLDANSSSGSTGNEEIISDDPSFSIGSNISNSSDGVVELDDVALGETFDKAYKQAKESGVVNTDDVRPLVPGYAEADILIRDSAYHSRASKLSMKVLAKMWNEDPTGEPVIVLAGGGGSGKTTASGVEFMESEFVIDTTMGGDWGVKEYQAEAATYGRAVQFIYVFTQFVKAFPRIIDRFLESVDSRLVPLDVAVRDHIGAQQNILNAPEDAVIFIFDNNGELGEQQLIDREKLKEYSYLNESLKRNEREDGAQRPSDARSSQETSASQRKEAEERLRRQGIKILDRYLEEGRIDQDIYDAFLGRYSSGDGGLDANSSSGSTGNGEIISDDPSFSIGSNNCKESADSSKEKAGKEPSKRKKKRAQREREEELRKVKRRGDRIGFIRDNYSDIPLGKHREQRNRKDELGKYIVDRHRGTKVVLDDAYFTVDESVKKGLVSMDKAIAKMMSVIPRAKDAAAHDNVYVNGTLQWEEDGRRCIQTLYKGGGCR